MLAPGMQVGPYRILASLGTGGMGEVYRAKDMRLGRDVAVKILNPRFAEDTDALGRFEREAKALAALSHPNILTIHDVGIEQNLSYAVMELLEGESLRTRLERSPLSWEKAVEIGIAIAEGLAAAHSKGVIHRDLKPENIFLTSDGRVKILDFGLVQWKQFPSPHDETSVPRNTTEPGIVVGTVGYMSPEQVRGNTVDARSDIFSFGCLIYEMVSGRSPFDRNTLAETMAAILRDEPPKIEESGKIVHPEAELILRRCLEKNPDLRFQSAQDLAYALKAILRGSGISETRRIGVQTHPYRIGALIVVFIIISAFLYLISKPDETIDSLAVLPFVNDTTDSETEYLSDGLTENIINSLSRLPKLRVVPRSTVFRYKGQEIDLKKIGSELNVRAVLTGRVIQRGDTLNIQAELVDVVSESQLWGEQYNRKISDILAVQQQIAEEISESLKLKLSGEEKKLLTKRYTESTEAYQLYLKGRYHWNKRTPDGLAKGIVFFQQAIEEDPTYALAYAGLSDSYNVFANYGYLIPREALFKAKAAALRAVELDETLAEAHTSLANTVFCYDRDWIVAEKEFKRAVELNPNYATAHQWYSLFLATQERFDEALAGMKRAQELEPLSLVIASGMGRQLYFARKYDQAIEHCRKTLELDPNYVFLQVLLGLAYLQKSMDQEALSELQKATVLSQGASLVMAVLGHGYARSGRVKEANKVLEDLEARSKKMFVPSYYFAGIYSGLGDKDRTMEWLEKAYAEHEGELVYLKVEPIFDNVRSDPRFQEFLRRIGLI